MDILVHVGLICIIAILFFIYKYSSSKNPMLFIILISIIGLIFLYQDETYIITGYNHTIIYDNSDLITNINSVPIEKPFGFTWALYLMYLSTFILATINISTGEEYNQK